MPSDVGLLEQRELAIPPPDVPVDAIGLSLVVGVSAASTHDSEGLNEGGAGVGWRRSPRSHLGLL